MVTSHFFGLKCCTVLNGEHKPMRMLLCEHPLSAVGQLPDGVGVVVDGMFEDCVTLQHQHGALLILRRWKERRMKSNDTSSTFLSSDDP